MADFDQVSKAGEKRELLQRVEYIYKSLQNEVVNYYWDKEPDTEEEYREHLRSIYNYVRDADHDLERIMDDLDKKLGY